MKRSLVLLLAIALLGCAKESTAREPKEISEEYLASLVNGAAEEGFNRLMQHSKLDEMKPADIEIVRGRVNEALRIFGRPMGFEVVRSSEFGKSLKQLLYFSLHESIPLSWEFTFYLSGGDWQLINLQYRDNLELLQ